jgi:hypothetical protein
MTTERIHFRLLQTPCCNSLLCWVNPRLPTYCPECATRIYPEIRSNVLMDDDKAILKYSDEALANYHRQRPLDDPMPQIHIGKSLYNLPPGEYRMEIHVVDGKLIAELPEADR